MSFERMTRSGVTFYRAEGWGQSTASPLRLSVSAPPFDTLNLGLSGDDPCLRPGKFPALLRRRRCGCRPHGRHPSGASGQCPHCDLRRCGQGAGSGADYDVDGLITNERGLPLVIHSRRLHPGAAARSGEAGHRRLPRRMAGTALGIAAKTARRMAEVYGTDPADLHCAIGPGISAAVFETRADVPEVVRAALAMRRQTLSTITATAASMWISGGSTAGGSGRWRRRSRSRSAPACDLNTFFSHRRMALPGAQWLPSLNLPELYNFRPGRPRR